MKNINGRMERWETFLEDFRAGRYKTGQAGKTAGRGKIGRIRGQGGRAMKGNYLEVDGAEVYEHEIQIYADEFIQRELNGDEKKVHNSFTRMIFYIADRIAKPKHDIELLDKIFDYFVRLCVKYDILPTLEGFSFLVKINNATFSDWKAGKYNSDEFGQTVKRWFDICKSFTIERLHNSDKKEINLIFISKAAYGMRETTPVELEKHGDLKPEMSAKEAMRRLKEHRQNQEKRQMPRPEDFGL